MHASSVAPIVIQVCTVVFLPVSHMFTSFYFHLSPLKCKHPNSVSKDITAESYFCVLWNLILGEVNSLESLPGTTSEVSTEFNRVFNGLTHLMVNSTGQHSNKTVTLKVDDEFFFALLNRSEKGQMDDTARFQFSYPLPCNLPSFCSRSE